MGKERILIAGIFCILITVVMVSGCTNSGDNSTTAGGEKLVKTITLTGNENNDNKPGVLELPANTKSVRVVYDLDLTDIVTLSYAVTNSTIPENIMISDEPADMQSPEGNEGIMNFTGGKYFVYPYVKGTIKVYATT